MESSRRIADGLRRACRIGDGAFGRREAASQDGSHGASERLHERDPEAVRIDADRELDAFSGVSNTTHCM
jgi:hypothetical protein